MRLPAISTAFSSAAPEMIAVPCWSSWKTGIFMRPPQFFLDDEALGRLDVFQVDAAEGGLQQLAGADDFLGILGGQFDVEHVDIGEALEQHAPCLPSPACPPSAPMLPSPSTAVPLVTTPTRLPFAVYL